jgi:hypothetical protein
MSEQPTDMLGRELKVGQRVARACTGKYHKLEIRTVARIVSDEGGPHSVYLNDSHVRFYRHDLLLIIPDEYPETR